MKERPGLAVGKYTSTNFFKKSRRYKIIGATFLLLPTYLSIAVIVAMFACLIGSNLGNFPVAKQRSTYEKISASRQGVLFSKLNIL